MPAANSEIRAGFYDVMEWIDTYKDTEYYFLDMDEEKEENIGRSLYDFIVDLCNVH
jgi:hypothetical protein